MKTISEKLMPMSRPGFLLMLAAVLVILPAGAATAQQSVTWTNAVGVSVSGNSLTKTAADGWGNSGASSTQTISSGDGYVEFTVTETNTPRLCGLNHSDPDQNYGINFALGLYPSGTLYVFESGAFSQLGNYSSGDTLRIAVEGGVVKYRQNGTLIHTSTTAPTYPLLVDTALYSTGATITNAMFSGGSNNPPTVSLTSPANNSSFNTGANISLAATASDSDGTITKVEFYQGSTKLGEDTSSPYSYTWTNVAAGTYSLTAKAIDNGNASTTSSAASITVNASSELWSTTTGGIYTSSGNVGIGTNSPTAKLHVIGDVIVTGNIAAKYQDLAEWVACLDQLPAGTVVILDTNKSNYVMASKQAYDTRVAGVISDKPGIALGEGGAGKVLVATTGRVRVKVDASKGAIQIGDLLVTSDVPGVAMKSQTISVGGILIHRPGTIIGKALEPLKKGKAEILVLLSLQ